MSTTTQTAPAPTLADAERRRDELRIQFGERVEDLERERREAERALASADDVARALQLIERREALTRELEAVRCVRRVLFERAQNEVARASAIEDARQKIADLEAYLPAAREADERERGGKPSPTREERALELIASCRERLARYEAGEVPVGQPV